ncbi:hypothetical protein [Paenibacillus sp. YN15]|uniref:hypothetical protein n=1 Tax=Paenibacillus sp. YN15 TaxID=1742774 RepID=UPI000DCB7F53|nr:hypothetical protein [Paenibacillus sp. YN15]RAV00550.1 hypothetical protein DQG13_13990 [Paenibacillus sp. YN15]
MKARPGTAIARKIIRRPRSAGLPKSQLMEMYRNQVKKFHTARTPVITQRTISIGTDGNWFNAAVIERHPDWVAVANANYVWYSGNLSRENAIVSTRFTLSQQRRILSASLFLAVDNYATVIINGVPLVYDGPTNQTSNFNPGRTFNIASFLRRGRNDVVIIAFNFEGARTAASPAGVAARLDIRQSAPE